jgi:hypothetical protein
MSLLIHRNWSLLLFSLLISATTMLAQNPIPSAERAVVREALDPPSENRAGQGGQAPEAYAPPANDNCSAATNLTVGAGCISGTTQDATLQGGEYLCISPGGGVSPETAWYRFTATATSMVLGVVLTNTSNCATVLAVYGPFAPGAGCLPNAGNQILCQNMGLIDPGFHPRLTGLTVGQTYLVQVQGNNCGGGNDRFANFCISINNVSANNSAGTASLINNCGTVFTGGTTGGHFANGTSVGNNNLDNNVGTSITGASEVGDDVTFVINNVSWFTFCNGNASSCNWSILLNGVTNCLLSAPNAGVQAAVFTGTPVALNNVAISPSNIPPGGSFNSGTFAVAAGACAYVMVDGFAGDECNYNLTLSNVSCPCALLPIELAYLSGRNLPEEIVLEWQMNAEEGVLRYIIEHSRDGEHFAPTAEAAVRAAGSLAVYQATDSKPVPGWNYYRLSAIDADGNVTQLRTASVFRQQDAGLDLMASMQGDFMQLDLHSPLAAAATLQLADLQGRVISREVLPLQVGSNRHMRSTEQLRAGMYMVTIILGDQAVSKRVVKF